MTPEPVLKDAEGGVPATQESQFPSVQVQQLTDSFGPAKPRFNETDIANLYEKTKELSRQITENIARSKQLSNDIDKAKRNSESIFALTLLGFLIVVFMLGAMVIDSLNNKSVSTENLANQINQQNLELQRLNNKFGAAGNGTSTPIKP